MTNPEKIKQILLSGIEKTNEHREDFCRHPGIDFTRGRKISFDTLLHFQISMESGSVNHELLKYFNFDAATPSLSAFYQQRAKLSNDVFQKLFYSFNNSFHPQSLLKGRYQLLACDGSAFTFTRNTKDTESYITPAAALKKDTTRCTSFLCMTCLIRFIPMQSSSPYAKGMSLLHYMN